MYKIGQSYTSCTELGKRDAFHVPAILAKVLGSGLEGGVPVIFIDDDLTTVEASYGNIAPHGVIDPFLGKVNPYTYCWVFLVPDSIKNLQHKFDVTKESFSSGTKIIRMIESPDDIDYLNDSCRGCYS
jgi:hypothetical protein